MAELQSREDLEQVDKPEFVAPEGMKPINRTEIDEKADALKAEIKLPAIPGRNVSFDKMMEWLELLNDSQWEYITIYMYRIWPKIVREQDPANIDPDTGDAIKYIDCFGGKFTRDDIVQMHGGGKYDFWVKDTGSGPKRTTLFKAKLEVSSEEADPIINPAELDWEARVNLAYVQKLRALGKARGKEFVNPSIQQASGDHAMMERMFNHIVQMSESERRQLRDRNPDNAFIEEAIRLAAKANEKPLEFMMEQMKSVQRESPSDYMKATAALLEAVKPTAAPAQDNSLIIAMMNNQMKLTELMMQQGNREHKEDSDEFGKLKSLLEIARDLKGGRTGESGWVDKAIEHGAPILGKMFDTINHVIALRARGIPVQMPTNIQTNPGQPQQPNRQTAAIPAGWGQRAADRQATTPPQAGPQPVEQPLQPEVVPQQQLTQEQEFVLQYGGLILQNMASGPGDDFAAWVSEGLGPAAFLNIKRMGKDNILAALKSVPEFWEPAMQNFEEQHVVRFVEEFFSFDPYKQDDGEGEE